MTFELTILGSGSALPTSRRYPTAQALNVLERFFLIDCGEGTQLQLRNARVKLGKLNTIFISHLHGDHVFGLFGLLSSFNLLGRQSGLTIYGPPDLEEMLTFFRKHFAEELQYSLSFIPLNSRSFYQVYDDSATEVFTFPLKHRIPTWGYLFREKPREPNIKKEAIERFHLGIKDILHIKSGDDFIAPDGTLVPRSDLIIEGKLPRSYAYCSDTSYYERISKWIEGVDLLYHEATFIDADRKIAKQTGHSTAAQAAMIAKNAKVKKLILGHFSNRYKSVDVILNEARAIFPESYLSEDLARYIVD
jgi:ribonuclease Z